MLHSPLGQCTLWLENMAVWLWLVVEGGRKATPVREVGEGGTKATPVMGERE